MQVTEHEGERQGHKVNLRKVQAYEGEPMP